MASLSPQPPRQGFQLGPERSSETTEQGLRDSEGSLQRQTGNTTFPKERGFILPGLLKEPEEASPSRAHSLPPAQEGGPAPTHREGSEVLGLLGAPARKWVPWASSDQSGSGALLSHLSLFTSKAKARLTPGSRRGRGLEGPLLPSPTPLPPAGSDISRWALTPVFASARE